VVHQISNAIDDFGSEPERIVNSSKDVANAGQ
jgi:hypothetical protein